MSSQSTPTATASVSPTASITPESSHSATTLALGISLAVVATIVFGGLAFYFVRRRYKRRKTQQRLEEISSHRRTYMVPVDPTHLAARVTPFGVNAPNVEVPKFGESHIYLAEALLVGTMAGLSSMLNKEARFW